MVTNENPCNLTADVIPRVEPRSSSNSRTGSTRAETRVCKEVHFGDRFQTVARELVKGKCLAELLSNPLRGPVGGPIEVQNAATIMGQHQKDVKDLKTDRGQREEVDGHQLLGAILQKCTPSLGRGLAGTHHLFADTALPDIEDRVARSIVREMGIRGE